MITQVTLHKASFKDHSSTLPYRLVPNLRPTQADYSDYTNTSFVVHVSE